MRAVVEPRAPLVALLVALAVAGPAPPARAERDSPEAVAANLVDGSEGRRVHAATRLYHLGRAELGVPLLAARLADPDPAERRLAAELLGLLRSEQAAVPLARALGDPVSAVRREVALALGQIGASGASRQLETLLGDPEAEVRAAAARALSEIDRDRAVAPLARVLAAEVDPEVRLHLVGALARSPTPRSSRALVVGLVDPIESVRVLAASHLVERGEARAARLLAERLSGSPGARSRAEAAAGLGRAVGGAARLARPALAEALGDREGAVRLAAAAALVALGDPRGRAHLSATAEGDGPPEERRRAVELLDGLVANE